MNSKLYRYLCAAILLPLLLMCIDSFTVNAGDDDYDFDVKSSSGTSTDGEVVYVYLQITNDGKDFGGYVRLILGDGSYYDSNVYETYVSIAAGTTENVTISIPIPEGLNLQECDATVKILDNKGEEYYSSRQKKLFTVNESQQFGILSNSNSGLDYLEKAFNDIYGAYYYGYGTDPGDSWTSLYMMQSELTDGHTLKQMSFLFIDDFDLSTLKNDEIQAIEEWTRLGGILVIGTGSYLDQSFSAFDDDFIKLELANKYTYSDFCYYSNTGYLNVADLDTKNSYTPLAYGELFKQDVGRGAIVVSRFSLSDPDLNTEYFGSELHGDLMSVLDSSNSGSSRSNYLSSYSLGRSYGVMQGKSSFSAGGLTLIIIIYLGLAGPGIYLILKKFDKREKIWIAVPVLSVFFVIIVFLISRGFDMRARQYTTIRIMNADGRETETDYIFGFSADRKDWNITLNDNADAAGPVVYENTYSFNATDERFRYRVSNTTAGLQLFYSPSTGFDPAYFKTKVDNTGTGGGMDFDISLDNSKIVGELENGTDMDFDHVLVVCYGYYDIIDDVESGEKITINSKSRQRYSGESTIEDLAKWYYNYDDINEARMHMALYFAAHELNDRGSFVVGVRKGSERVIKGNVSEDMYLCVYGVE